MYTENAKQYFMQNTKKVYIDKCSRIESFEEYFNHHYPDNCYNYSTYALMGLKSNDFLVRGYISSDTSKNFHHGWVEFKFDGKEYVFDSELKEIVLRQDYYAKFNPNVEYRKNQREILSEYLNEKCAIKVEDEFWQFKYVVMNTDKTDISSYDFIVNDITNGYVPSALSLSRVVISKFNSEIKSFIAYTEASY